MTATAKKTLDDSIAKLIAPATPALFAEKWGREPLLIRGSPHRYDYLIDERGFRAAMATGRPRVAVLDPADPDEPLTAGSTRLVDPREIDAEMAAGRTVCVTGLSDGHPALAQLAAAFARTLGVPGVVRVNAFLSPPGSGADLHIDARVTLSLQVSGRKQWWHGARPAVSWPRSNAQVLPGGQPVWMYPWCGAEPWERLTPVRRADLDNVVLNPGDLLCLPAGTWHAACAVDRSLALNISISPADPARELADLLDPLLRGDPLWRGGLSLAPGGDDTRRQADLARLRALVRAALQRDAP